MSILRFNLMHHSAEQITLKNIDKKRIRVGNLLIFACFFMYMMSMAVKAIYASQIAYIQQMWQIGYAQTSLANTFYFVTYGLTQVVLFFVMKKISIKKYIAYTVPFSAVCAILMGTSSGIVEMWAYFGLLGALQAGIYCGCNSVLTRYLPTKQLTKANKVMNLGFATGTVIAYTTSALCITYDKWRIPYFILGGIYMVSIIVFLVSAYYAFRFRHINELLDKHQKDTKVKIDYDSDTILNLNSKKKIVWFYIINLILTFIITSIYYFVMNNITPLLVKEHGLNESIAIYVSIIAPITMSFGPLMVISACNRRRNFVGQGVLYSLIILPMLLLLTFFYKSNVILTLAMTIVVIILTKGVQTISISVITFKMRKQINVGAYSAITNAVASLAAGTTPTILGGIIDAKGWQTAYATAFAIMAVFIVAMIVVNFIVCRSDKKRKAMQSA